MKLGQGEEKSISALRDGVNLSEPFNGSAIVDQIERAIRETFSKPEAAGITEEEPAEKMSDRSDTKPGRRKKT
jgi:hypothetical protein